MVLLINMLLGTEKKINPIGRPKAERSISNVLSIATVKVCELIEGA